MKRLLLALLLLTSPAVAQEEAGSRAYVAWQCYTWGQYTKPTKKGEGLFAVGLAAAKEFMAAYRAGKIERKSNTLSAIWSDALAWQEQGDGFVIGLVFGTAQEWAVRMMTEKLKKDEWDLWPYASLLYSDKNCGVIR